MTIGAVLTVAQEAAFRERYAPTGPLEARVHGWSKVVVLSSDRVFAFPKEQAKVEALDREATALRALHDFEHSPTLIGRHHHDDVWPHPFLELERMAGTPFYGDVYEAVDLDVALDLMAQLGAALAAVHDHPTERVAASLTVPVTRTERPLDRALTGEPETVANEIADALGRPTSTSWVDAITAVQATPPVLTHGDIHGEQLMMHDGALVGLVDWETAAIDNPLRDIDFGEWGRGWHRAHEGDFPHLREVLWTSYANARSTLVMPEWPAVDVFLGLIDAWRRATRA